MVNCNRRRWKSLEKKCNQRRYCIEFQSARFEIASSIDLACRADGQKRLHIPIYHQRASEGNYFPPVRQQRTLERILLVYQIWMTSLKDLRLCLLHGRNFSLHSLMIRIYFESNKKKDWFSGSRSCEREISWVSWFAQRIKVSHPVRRHQSILTSLILKHISSFCRLSCEVYFLFTLIWCVFWSLEQKTMRLRTEQLSLEILLYIYLQLYVWSWKTSNLSFFSQKKQLCYSIISVKHSLYNTSSYSIHLFQ